MRGRAVSARTRAAAGALAAFASAVALAAPAAAHLPLGDRSLIAVFARADGVVVARALSATVASPTGASAETRFRVLAPVVGEAPTGEVTVVGDAPALRYPAGESAIVAVGARAGGSDRWASPQIAGMRLTLAASDLDEETRAALRDLFHATHAGGPAPIDARAAVAALVALAASREAKLASLAALEVAGIADHPADFSAESRRALARAARASGADPARDAAIALALRRLAAAGPESASSEREAAR